ncbi:MAG: SEL1-like repeat protein [Planctomycetaceae bacterium]|jgi:TPR repeat protein|nr:SEL1-like repeat protein [Planctomycetaceae bacterium]
MITNYFRQIIKHICCLPSKIVNNILFTKNKKNVNRYNAYTVTDPLPKDAYKKLCLQADLIMQIVGQKIENKEKLSEIDLLQKEIYEKLRLQADLIMRLIGQKIENMEKLSENGMYYVLIQQLKLLFKILSACSGDLDATYKIGEYYSRDSYGLPKDEQFAYRLFLFAALLGHKRAVVKLGYCLANGIGVPRSIKDAVFWYEEGINFCDAFALEILGNYYSEKQETDEDRRKAIKYYVAAAAARHPNKFNFYSYAANEGSAHAQFMLAFIYLEGYIAPQDIKTGFQWLHKAVEQNYSEAQIYLGDIYMFGKYDIEVDLQTAAQWFRLADAQGNYKAKKFLAMCLLQDNSSEKNTTEAISILAKLAQDQYVKKPNQNDWEHIPADAECQDLLSTLYFNETIPEYNPKEAIRLLREAAQRGVADAQADLGVRLLHGNGVKQNVKEARHFLRKAANKNNATAQFYLAEIYAEGNGVQVNRTEALKWYCKSATADYTPALQIVADWFIHDKGMWKNELTGYSLLALLARTNDEEALTLLTSAATSGNANAQLALYGYYNSQHRYRAAKFWLESASKQELPMALYKLACYYRSTKDNKQYIHYLQLAAEKDFPDAQVDLALAYESGIEMPKDLEKAFQLMKIAADKGHVQANYYLGNLYKDGTGTIVDIEKAVECYKIAANGGSSDGLERLGTFYALGNDHVKPDPILGFNLIQHSAKMGNPKGQCSLGYCYLKGIGCGQSIELAFQWISIAAQSGHPAVLRFIQDWKLDIPKLSEGYTRLQKLEQQLFPKKRFDQILDQIFCNEKINSSEIKLLKEMLEKLSQFKTDNKQDESQ